MKELLKKLIQARSTVDVGELAAANILADYFTDHGFDCRVDTWDNEAGVTRANCLGHLKSSGENPALLFASHLDVVPPGDSPWSTDPFDPVETDGRIYGRGSTDMKGPMVAAAAAIVDCLESGAELKGDIIFAATAGEETDSCGIKRFVKDFQRQSQPIAGIIIPEPTDFKAVIAHRGMLWLEITTAGKTAHSSMPHLGVNAVSKMMKLLDHLKDFQPIFTVHPLLGAPSMSVNVIHGGKAANVVPDSCSVTVDIRTVPGQLHTDITEQLKGFFEELERQDSEFHAEIEILRTIEALEGDADCEFVSNICRAGGIAETSAVGYTTDGPFLLPLEAPIVIFGPGKSSICHQPDEYIEIADIETGTASFKKMITSILCD